MQGRGEAQFSCARSLVYGLATPCILAGTLESEFEDTMTYPQYEVNRKVFGTDYATANLYWQANGGILMEKLDAMTSWHVLQTKETI